MVTTTEEHDELPARDVYGTDLRRVREMHARGYPATLIAECLNIEPYKAHYAVVVATGDREGSPEPGEIARLCSEIQLSWTTEQATAAKHGEPRTSAIIVRPNGCTHEETQRRSLLAVREKQRVRVEEGPVPVEYHPEWQTDLKYEARVRLHRKCGRRAFATHEEAEAWGREWLLREWNKHQAEACCGR